MAAQAELADYPAAAGTGAPQGIELRHLRYFVALADAGSFTHAAERIFIAQSTLSQQIRRLEEIVGTPLLQRRREGLRLTAAGNVLLDASRNVLSLVDHEVSRTRQAAGLGRPRLRVVMPPGLPESVAVAAAAGLRSAAATAEVDVIWLETALDAEFSLIGTRRADAGLGWLTAGPEALPEPLDAMVLGEFEPDVWIPSSHAAARRGAISLEELAVLDVIHGPRRAQPATYDAWTKVLQEVDPRFGFTDPPFRRSLPMTLSFAATGDRPTAVLTGPATPARAATPIQRPRSADRSGMVRASLTRRPLTASAALVWSGDLPRALQQMLFETADALAPPASAQRAELACLSRPASGQITALRGRDIPTAQSERAVVRVTGHQGGPGVLIVRELRDDTHEDGHDDHHAEQRPADPVGPRLHGPGGLPYLAHPGRLIPDDIGEQAHLAVVVLFRVHALDLVGESREVDVALLE